MAIATNALLALFIAALLLHLLWKQWRGAAAKPLLRAAGLAILGVIALTLVKPCLDPLSFDDPRPHDASPYTAAL